MDTQVMGNVEWRMLSGSLTTRVDPSPVIGISARVSRGSPILTRTLSTLLPLVKSCRVRMPAPVSAVISCFETIPWS